MNIVHVCTTDEGGAAKAVLRLQCGLEEIGIASKLLVLHRKTSYENVEEIAQDENVFRGKWNAFMNKCLSLRIKPQKQLQNIISSDKAIHRIHTHPLIQNADVIHLHWIATMIDYRSFFANLKDRCFVWTLHDMNPFTGGCHCSEGRTKYETGCGACPALTSTDTSDPTYRTVKRKENAYMDSNISFVTPSIWLRDCAQKSYLLGSR